MPLFEVAILEKPTPKESKDGAVEKLLLGPIPIVAQDIQAAGFVAAFKNKDMLGDTDPSKMVVLVRPFA